MLDEIIKKRKAKEEDTKKLGLAPDLEEPAPALEGSGEGMLNASQPEPALEDPAAAGVDIKLQDLLLLDDNDKARIQQMIEAKKQGKDVQSSLSDKVMMKAMEE